MSREVWLDRVSEMPAAVEVLPNGLIDWTANGGQRLYHSSATAAPLSSNHRQR